MEGGDGLFQVVWGTDLEVHLERTKLLRGVIGSISRPNDYLKTVFDDVVSLPGSCENNALSRSPREKLQLVADAVLSLRVKCLVLSTRKEYMLFKDRPVK